MIPPSRGRPRAPANLGSAPPPARLILLVLAFKLISFGLIACFVWGLAAAGYPAVVAVSAAMATATSAGIGRGLVRRQRGPQLA
jgi:hypothetical protein